MLHWFMDDGNSYYRKRNTTQVVITFCCEGFKPQYVELLRDICNRTTPIPFALRKYNQGYGYRLTVKQSAYLDFFQYIGTSPIDEMSYKWKLKNPLLKELP